KKSAARPALGCEPLLKSSGSTSKRPEMTLILLNALLPIFVGLLLGYIAGRRGVMDNLNVRNLIVLVMDIAIPCALFYTISRTSWPVLREQSESAVMIAVVFVTLY